MKFFILTIIKSLKPLLAVIAVWFFIHSIYITFDGLKDNNTKADVAIVFGNKVNEDGTVSNRLKERLNKSIDLYHQKRIKKIIVSGGLGKEGYWEANKMKEYLLFNKIPNEKIIVDNYGNDTQATVQNSIKILDKLSFKSAISVSQYFHQTRVKKLFIKNGFENIESSSPMYFEIRDFYSIFREFFAFYLEVL